ncbi:MAG: electron transport complex subunit RsxC [Dehalococcoidia bacterium]|nr:Electron transport complex subunit RnfC [Chloroflexota bacterium]MBT9161706.1 Electron transport complex subunit RnfC [Chloroflexota bacterium]
MKVKVFPAGGIAIPHRKGLTEAIPIKDIAPPETVVIPLHQHSGAPCEALVVPGGRVVKGQKIGDTDARISAPVHSSVTGRVEAVGLRPTVRGEVLSVVIRREDSEDSGDETSPARSINDLEATEIIAAIREAGVVGLGGEGFPTHFKWMVPPDFPVDTVIINGAECEPYLTADHRLLVERTGDVMSGLRLAMKATGARRGVIAIENNKPDAIEAARDAVRQWYDIDVVVLGTKYPQGAKKMLTRAVLGREVPPHTRSYQEGVVINNVQTAVAAADAVLRRKPLYEKVITVSGGAVNSPANLVVPIGMSFRDVLSAAGGTSGNFRLVVGGPMTGVGVDDLDLPLTKTVTALLALTPAEYFDGEAGPCIRCARCVNTCPMRLTPSMIVAYIERGDVAMAEQTYIEDCMECGVCAFVCPARRPLVQQIKEGKTALAASQARAS